MIENNHVETDVRNVCEIFNNYFIKHVSVIDKAYPVNSTIDRPITEVIESFKEHGSIATIKENIVNPTQFSFKNVTQNDVYMKLKKLNPKKACGHDKIPARLLKIAAKPLSVSFTPLINASITNSIFPHQLKYADVSPVFKKSDNLVKENYRPISVLTSISKVFESIMCDQMVDHFKDLLSIWLAAYRARYSCNNVLLHFVEYLKQALDKGDFAACILMDLSEAFDCLPHDLLIAKLNAYGMTISGCKLIHSYLSNRQQRVKIHDTYSSWGSLDIGVPQGSITGPLLFNIFINDLFMHLDPDIQLYNYADDNTLVYSNQDKAVLISKLELASAQAIGWFKNNGMQANPNKFQSMFLNRKIDDSIEFKIGESIIIPDECVKLLGVFFDDHLKFDRQIEAVCKKAGKQINALRRTSKFLNTESKLKIFNAFIASHFNFCPLIYDQCSFTLARKLEKMQERALRFVLNDFSSTYNELLRSCKKVPLAQTRKQLMAEQVFKIIHDLAPPFTKSFFTQKHSSYSLRDMHKLEISKFKTVSHGKRSFIYRGAQLWNMLPPTIKSSESFKEFKHKLKLYTGQLCKCGSCFLCFSDI